MTDSKEVISWKNHATGRLMRLGTHTELHFPAFLINNTSFPISPLDCAVMMNMHDEEPVSWNEKLGFKPLDLLKLDNFIAPTLLLVLYWISMVGGVLLSLFTLISGLIGLFQHFLVGIGTLLVGLLMLFLLPLYTRVLFEMGVVFFNIHNHLKALRQARAR